MAVEIPADLDATRYVEPDAVDDVAELRIGGTAWLALTDEQKEGIADTVTLEFDALDFIGERTDDDQNLEWPRTGTDYSDDAWPQRLITAAIEYAIALAATVSAGADPLNPDPSTGNVKREKVGPIETEYFAPTSAAVAATATSTVDTDPLASFPAIVQKLLRPLVRVAQTASWGSAIVVRGS